jgi:hypothetical protein
MENANKTLVKKPEATKPGRKSICRREDNIKANLNKIQNDLVQGNGFCRTRVSEFDP